jgi:hypothetical protein
VDSTSTRSRHVFIGFLTISENLYHNCTGQAVDKTTRHLAQWSFLMCSTTLSAPALRNFGHSVSWGALRQTARYSGGNSNLGFFLRGMVNSHLRAHGLNSKALCQSSFGYRLRHSRRASSSFNFHGSGNPLTRMPHSLRADLPNSINSSSDIACKRSRNLRKPISSDSLQSSD